MTARAYHAPSVCTFELLEPRRLLSASPFLDGDPDRPITTVVADLNRDGKADIVVAVAGDLMNPGDAVPSWSSQVMLNDGNGGMQTSATIIHRDLAARNILFTSVRQAIGDVNGDGVPDLVFTYEPVVPPGTAPEIDGGVMLGDGQGNFSPGPTFVLHNIGVSPTSFSPDVAAQEGLALADLNGDGHADVFVWAGGQIGIVPGGKDQMGDGSVLPNPVAQFAAQNGFGPGQIVGVVDMNRDGIPDVVCSMSGNHKDGWNLAVAPGIRTTTGVATGMLTTTWSMGPVQVINAPGGPTSPPTRIVVGDVNGDGVPDVIAMSANAFQVGISTTVPGSLDLSVTWSPSTVVGRTDDMFFGDVNGDGTPDLFSLMAVDVNTGRVRFRVVN